MNGDIFRADYETLAELAEHFGRQSEIGSELESRVRRSEDYLFYLSFR